MCNPLEATRHHNLIKLLILLPLRAIYFRTFQCEIPCIKFHHKALISQSSFLSPSSQQPIMKFATFQTARLKAYRFRQKPIYICSFSPFSFSYFLRIELIVRYLSLLRSEPYLQILFFSHCYSIRSNLKKTALFSIAFQSVQGFIGTLNKKSFSICVRHFRHNPIYPLR